ncbi:succinate dehydrogenase assembly factor 2, mitochondrial-like protein [Polychytrium aggregatum]|uniref:succinate dehydrogenase assembly factor 2, mitochondrial-like protein n=1 Tax=Polychytrium aggregatum TaxID=110093 RepID=UPI0022FEE561|nr:succinate dehydrogenase assembly factor 2, mitochondrial-like protein [Polychytrium aggregatum]KAI9203637.1 succinate dehydrogenase assembly factor 2, mitochondrial-like protein [Polychytrium aggregatum]
MLPRLTACLRRSRMSAVSVRFLTTPKLVWEPKAEWEPQAPDWSRKWPSPSEQESDEFETFQPAEPLPFLNRSPDEPTETKRARLLYQVRKRGILENDLILATFAKTQLPKMDAEALAQFDHFLEENDWDIFYWATGARRAPERIKKLVFWADLVEHAKNKDKRILRMPDL